MATFRMMYVKAYKDRHGRQRYYLRRPGFAPITLPGEPGSKAFAEAYEAGLACAPALKSERIVPGTFSALIAAYYDTAMYADLTEGTKRTYRRALEKFRDAWGPVPVQDFTPALCDDVMDALAAKPGARENLRKPLRLVLKLAVRRGYLPVSPMDGVRLPRAPIKGFAPWSEAEIAAYEKRWATGTRERLALALCLYTVQRRGDVVVMGRQHTKPGKIHVAQAKSLGKTRLWIPIHPNLQRELDQVPPGQLTFLQTQYGLPFSPAGFTNWFHGVAKEAGLTDRTPHGLRKAGSRRLAEAGCTPHQIMAVTGHKNLSEVTLYTASADQERLAEEAIARTNVSNLGGAS